MFVTRIAYLGRHQESGALHGFAAVRERSFYSLHGSLPTAVNTV